MRTRCIIRGGITSSLPTKENNPVVPITVAEQVESTQQPFDLSHILKAAQIAAAHDRPVATEAEARQILGLAA